MKQLKKISFDLQDDIPINIVSILWDYFNNYYNSLKSITITIAILLLQRMVFVPIIIIIVVVVVIAILLAIILRVLQLQYFWLLRQYSLLYAILLRIYFWDI